MENKGNKNGAGANYSITDKKGRVLKTERDFVEFYSEYVREQKKIELNFDELEFLKEERQLIINLIKINEPDCDESAQYKFELQKYLGGFLNRQLFVLEEELKNSKENFKESVRVFSEKRYQKLVSDFKAKIEDLIELPDSGMELIMQELKITKNRIEEWVKEGMSQSKEYQTRGEFEAGKNYYTFLEDLLKSESADDSRVYWIKEGKEVMSAFDFANRIGLVERMKEKYGAVINPTHDFEKLKKVRLDIYDEKYKKFLEERNMKGLLTENCEAQLFYASWLNNEILVANNWLGQNSEDQKAKRLPSTSDQIEILKYKQFVNDEIVETERLINSTQITKTETKQEQQTENDFTLSTIEDWLFEFKEKMSEFDYQTLVSALKQYFDTGTFPTLSKTIQINGRPNKKLFGWNLNRLFKENGKGVEKELLQFAKQNISLFTDVPFDETNILKSNLYKYFTTKTK